MIRIEDKSLCCGCTACSSVCPHDAISMRPDPLGFLYPQVEPDKCVDCGLCETVCDFARRRNPEKTGDAFKVYAARNRDAEVLAGSQSGGVFSALSDQVLSEDGVVYGAAYERDFTVSHFRAWTAYERDLLRGSKYVQSRMGDCFRLVKSDLESGRKVLFSGTPCQVAGLLSCIPESLQESLVTVDFVCHGVPSPAVWKDYVAYMQKKSKAVSVRFRDKSAGGWKVHRESFVFEDGRKIYDDTFRVLFYKNIMLRHSCSVCPYHLSERASDLTLADFWGIEETLLSFDGPAGTSMISINTDKGADLLGKASGSLELCETLLTRDFLERRNPNFLCPALPYKDRHIFEEAYASKGFVYVARRWGDLGWRYKVWQMKVFIRKIIGRK